jgi:NAD(P)H-dependent FMN reductase
MTTQDITRPVFVPVIIGTPRQGRLTEPAANFVFGEVSKRSDIQTELIDIRKIPLRIDDAGKPSRIRNSRPRSRVPTDLSSSSRNTIISFPGLLKHVLDTNLKEYVHKAVGVCGVSAGPFGGVRMIESLVPVLRELGLVTIFWDVYFGTAGKLFDPATGKITDPAYVGRLEKFLNELVWMARALRYARENIPGA